MIIMRLTDLQNDQKSLRVGISELKGAITSAYIGLESKNDTYPKFLFYSLYHNDISKTFYTYGGGVRQSMSFNDFKDIKIPLPALSTQRAIATFLDKKTETIDALIDKKQQLITLLEEKRVALINQVVTKGLDPEVPLKESGIEWIGRIPEHWELQRLKFETSHIVDCLHSTPDYIDDGEFHAIRTADISPGKLNLKNTRKVSKSSFIERNQRLTPKHLDIIYSREGERFGMAALIPKNTYICLAQRVIILRIKKSSPTYIMWALNSHSVYNQALEDTVGSTSPRVNISTIMNFWLTIPPLAEQEAIAAYLDKELERLDAIIEKTRATIEKLTEYRQALITAAVTGQLNIGEPEDEDGSPRGEPTDEGPEDTSQLELC